MTCKYCGTNWKKDVTLGELREEIKRRKTLAENELDAYMASVWPARNWTNWLTILSIIPAFLGASFFHAFMLMHYGAFIREHVWGIPALFLATGIVFFLIYSPRIYWSRKESRLIRGFRNKHPEYAEALWRA